MSLAGQGEPPIRQRSQDGPETDGSSREALGGEAHLSQLGLRRTVLSVTDSADEIVVQDADADQRVRRRSDVVIGEVRAFGRAPIPAARHSDARGRA